MVTRRNRALSQTIFTRRDEGTADFVRARWPMRACWSMSGYVHVSCIAAIAGQGTDESELEVTGPVCLRGKSTAQVLLFFLRPRGDVGVKCRRSSHLRPSSRVSESLPCTSLRVTGVASRS